MARPKKPKTVAVVGDGFALLPSAAAAKARRMLEGYQLFLGPHETEKHGELQGIM